MTKKDVFNIPLHGKVPKPKPKPAHTTSKTKRPTKMDSATDKAKQLKKRETSGITGKINNWVMKKNMIKKDPGGVLRSAETETGKKLREANPSTGAKKKGLDKTSGLILHRKDKKYGKDLDSRKKSKNVKDWREHKKHGNLP